MKENKINKFFILIVLMFICLACGIFISYAYFSIIVSDDLKNNTYEKTTYTVTNATMKYGATINSSNAYPGHKEMKLLTITGTSPSVDNKDVKVMPIKTRITVSALIPDEFLNDVVWNLVKVDKGSTVNSVNDGSSYLCSNDKKNIAVELEDGSYVNRYFEVSTCPNFKGTIVATNNDDESVNIDLKSYNYTKDNVLNDYYVQEVTSGDIINYVLIVEYKDNGNQSGILNDDGQLEGNSQEDLEFSISLNYAVDASSYE